MRRKILSDAKRDLILGDLIFARKMLNTKKLTADDLSAVVRHLDMARNDLVEAISDVQKQH
jgi:hypothetical protein